MIRPSLLAVSACLALACTRGAEPTPATVVKPNSAAPGSGAPGSTAADPATGAPPAGATFALPKLGLTTVAPADTVLEDALVGEGVMLRGPALELGIEEAGASRPTTLDEARKEVDMYAPTDVVVESLPDGFVITFAAEGGMGRNYWLEGRRTLGDKAFWCEANTPRAEARAGALVACKGLAR